MNRELARVFEKELLARIQYDRTTRTRRFYPVSPILELKVEYVSLKLIDKNQLEELINPKKLCIAAKKWKEVKLRRPLSVYTYNLEFKALSYDDTFGPKNFYHFYAIDPFALKSKYKTELMDVEYEHTNYETFFEGVDTTVSTVKFVDWEYKYYLWDEDMFNLIVEEGTLDGNELRTVLLNREYAAKYASEQFKSKHRKL